MDITQAIARNLSAWMECSKDLKTLKALARASKVGFGTVQRAKNGIGNTTIQNLEALAHTFKREVADLIHHPDAAYLPAPPARLVPAREPDPEEGELLQGYRDATVEVRAIMIEAARQATKKVNFSKRSDQQ